MTVGELRPDNILGTYMLIIITYVPYLYNTYIYTYYQVDDFF